MQVARLGIWSRAAIRGVDLAIAILMLILLCPFLLVIALAIRLTSAGPALLRQTRVGQHGTPFVMLKFRTMQRNNDDSAHRAFVRSQLAGGDLAPSVEPRLHKLDADPRVTRLGGLLRRLSVDELPQLINVVLGQMSLVGPRPALPWEVRLYEPWHYVRFEAKPGITGLWQVSGRSHVSMRDALALDADYVAHRSLGLDLAIIVKTVPKVLSRHGAY
jgi:lipopolysaccharide/colanic/teichoic acid biosynthesis glycosyltransferase